MLLCKRRAPPPPASASSAFDVEGAAAPPPMQAGYLSAPPVPPAVLPSYSVPSQSVMPKAPPTAGAIASPFPTAGAIASPFPTAGAIASPFPSAPPPVPSPSAKVQEDKEELRMDCADGNLYPLSSFIEEYGGSFASPPREWHAAKAQAQTATPMVPAATASAITSPFPSAPPVAPFSIPVASHGAISGESVTPAAQAFIPQASLQPAQASVPQGPGRVERFQAAFDPLLEKAVALHSDPAGQEGVRKGVRELYHKLGAGDLQGAVLEKLVRLVAAIEVRDCVAANQVREQIVRTTTAGWVEGGTWQWCLKHLIDAAKQEDPTEAQVAKQQASDYSAPSGQELSPENTHVINTLMTRLDEARPSMDARKADDIAKRLDGLCTSLRNGFVSANTCSQLCAVVQAAEQKDNTSVQRCLQDIAKQDFESSKAWLSALKQLLR